MISKHKLCFDGYHSDHDAKSCSQIVLKQFSGVTEAPHVQASGRFALARTCILAITSVFL